jgi:POT family proton-dependent oligopeptide transporter
MSATAEDQTPVPSTASDRAFLGHPRGLGYLAFAEGWERFSYYGMQTLLVLYMTQQLFLPGHVDHIAGFAGFRSFIEWLYRGHLDPQPLASATFGLYAGLVYLTPIAGGIIADRLLGRTRTITIGALLMAAGHFLMAFEVSFLLALLCLLVGVGCFKGNIATQVGELYGPEDLRRADAFQIFLLAVNIAVIIAPLVCGYLGQEIAWQWGFGAAGVGMLIGLGVYLSGRRWLPDEIGPGRDRQKPKAERPPLGPGDDKRIIVLVLLLPLLVLSALGNQEIFNAYLLWGDANFDLSFLGHAFPVSFLISLDAFISTGMIFLSLLFWRWYAKHRSEPDEITKLTIGALISALAPLALAVAAWQEAASGQKVGLGWALAFHVINDIGFANVFPVGIALYSRASPRGVAATMIGVYYSHLFAANMLVGKLGGYLSSMPAGQFWLMHAILVGVGALGLLVVRAAAGRVLAPSTEDEAQPV